MAGRLGILKWYVSDDGSVAGYVLGAAEPGEALASTGQQRLPVLGAALAFPGYIAYAEEIDWGTARELVAAARDAGIPIESYVGHPATAELASKLLGVRVEARRAEYRPAPLPGGEAALAVRLRRRPPRPGEVAEVSPEDVQVLWIHYVPA